MPFDLWILPSKRGAVFAFELFDYSGIDLVRQLTDHVTSASENGTSSDCSNRREESTEQVDVDEVGRCCGQPLRHDVEEDLRADRLVFGPGSATTAFQSGLAELEGLKLLLHVA